MEFRFSRWACILALAWFAVPSSGDSILGQERPLLPPVLQESRNLYSFVPGTLSADNWAARELQTLRMSTRPVEHVQSSTVNVFDGAVVSSSDGGTDSLDHLGDLNLDLGGQPTGGATGGQPSGLSEGALANMLSNWGLSAGDMAPQLPALAIKIGSYVDFLNSTSLQIIRRLRALMGTGTSLRNSVAMEQIGSQGSGKPSITRDGGNRQAAKEKKQEQLKATKRVVRSVFKIALGFILGVLLWMLVSRM